MEIKYLEWNLRAMGGIGYEIPSFVSNYINSVDIFALVEFCASNGWREFKHDMEKEFDLYCSPFVSKGYNQVCIGVRRNLMYKLIAVKTVDVCDVNRPEFLQVDIEIENKKLSIIGTRIKTESGTKLIQYNYLKGCFENIDRFLCLGDFNCVHKTLSEYFSLVAKVYGPRIVNDYHSFVFKDGDRVGLDWLVEKGLDSVYNGYQDVKYSSIATYDWSFLTEENGYLGKTEYDYLGIKGLPDHAILKGMVKF